MRVALIVLSLSFGAHANESVSDLVAKLEAERDRKAALINQVNYKQMLDLEAQAEAEGAANLNSIGYVESKSTLEEAKIDVEEQMLGARNKISEAEDMEEKASSMQSTVAKLAFESSFLEQEARKKSMRDRDTSFVQMEVDKLEKKKKELQAEQKELRSKAKIMKEEGETLLRQSENQWSGVEGVSQQNEARPKHMAPKWMIEAQLQEAEDAHTENGEQLMREKVELRMQKSNLWKQMGKKYTCAEERNQMKAFIIDSKQDSANRADCLEKQLDKYCLDSLRAPAVTQQRALKLMQQKKECLPFGVDQRVPEKRRAAVASKWCSVVEILQGVTAQPLKQKYFALLEDHVKVDKSNFEETLKSFADEYVQDWDLVQVDPSGKHNDADKMADFAGKPVYRNSRNGQYLGFNTVLLKTKSAPKILDAMMNMAAVPLDTLPTLLNEKDGKISAVSLAADIVDLPKSTSLIAKNSYSKCSVQESGLAELQQMPKPSALIETGSGSEALDFFAFEKKLGEELVNQNWAHDESDF